MAVVRRPVLAKARQLPSSRSQWILEIPSQSNQRNPAARDLFASQAPNTANAFSRSVEFRSLVILAGGVPGPHGDRHGSAAISLLPHARGHPGEGPFWMAEPCRQQPAMCGHRLGGLPLSLAAAASGGLSSLYHADIFIELSIL